MIPRAQKQARGRRVVILGGAGAMGRIIARDLATTGRGAVEPIIADRDLGPARELGVETRRVDVTDPTSLARAVRGAAVVIASLPYRFNLLAMDATLEARASYIDLGGLFHVTKQQLRRAKAFRSANVTALLGMGSAPGIINVLAARAALGLDRVREVHCMVGAIDRTPYRRASLLPFGYAPDTLLDEFAKPSAVYRAGRLQMVAPLDPRERLRVRFPAPVGPQWIHTTLHSEVATLPAFFADRGIREVTFRQTFDEAFAQKLEWLVQLGLVDTVPLKAAAGAAPRDILLALLRKQPAAEPIGPADRYEILRVEVRGEIGGRPVTVIAECHADQDSGDGVGPDIDTGAPPSIAAQLLVSGEMESRPGVWAPEQLVPYEPFARELERRKMSVRITRRTER